MLEGATFAIAGATVFGDEGWADRSSREKTESDNRTTHADDRMPDRN